MHDQPYRTHENSAPGAKSCCVSAQQLKRWLDGRETLTETQVSDLQHCSACQELLERYTRADDLRATDDGDATEGLQAYDSEPELAEIQRNLATPQQTPASQFETMEETPSQVDSQRPHTSLAHQRRSVEQSWLTKHFDPDRYVFEGIIGRGGCADVHRVYDSLLDKQFAVKTIVGDSEKGRLRMLREAKLMADIEHENILRIYDVGQINVEGHPPAIFIVMEYMPGGTLIDLLSDGQPPQQEEEFRRIARLLAGACRGLEVAHGRSIVHRDLKPANVLLSADHQVAKVADFGLASREDEQNTMLTRTGAIVGTPAFMSPEQASAAEKLGALSDVYALGASLYFLLTGQPPFLGNPTAVARQVVDADPVAPTVLNPQVPMPLAAICERAMEKEPERRYASAAGLAADLEAYAAGRDVTARTLTSWGRLQRILRRDRRLSTAVTTAFLSAGLVLVVSLASALLFRSQSKRLSQAVKREREAKVLYQQTLARSIEAADQLLVSVTEDLTLLPSSPGSDRVSDQLLERARIYYTQFLVDNKDNAELRFQLARSHAGLAKIAFRQADFDKGRTETQAALALLDEVDSSSGDSNELDTVAEWSSQMLRSRLLFEQGAALGMNDPTSEESAKSLSECALVAERVVDAADSQNQECESRTLLVRAIRAESVRLSRSGNDDLSGELAKRADTVARELYSAADGSGLDAMTKAKALKAAALAAQTLGLYQLQHQQFEAGVEAIERAIDIVESVPNEQWTALRLDPIRATLYSNRARIATIKGDWEAARGDHNTAIAIHERLKELEPDVPMHRQNLVDAILNSTGTSFAQEDFERVISDSESAITILDELIALQPENAQHRQTKAMLLGNIGTMHVDMGNPLLAIQPVVASLADLQAASDALNNPPAGELAVAYNHYTLSQAYWDLGQYDEAFTSLDSSDRVTRAILQEQPDFTAAQEHLVDSLFRRAEIHVEIQPLDYEAAMAAAQAALKTCQSQIAVEPELLGFQTRRLLIMTTTCDILLAAGMPDEALAKSEEVLAEASKLESKFGATELEDARFYAYLAEYRALEQMISQSDMPAEALTDRMKKARAAAEKLGAVESDFQPQSEAEQSDES
ncbi:MAG TPA: hypothetical protein DDW52_28300 [Planctomycetaceae bacterium]|nr:hypothetical protein [Planctomycetaceae bacterium]